MTTPLDKALNALLVTALPLMPKPLVGWVARQYVAGETMADMVKTVRALNAEGCMCTVDVLGEYIERPEEARVNADTYHAVLRAIRAEKLDANVSVKLTAIGLGLDDLAKPELCEGLMTELIADAEAQGNFVRIDMENAPYTEATISLYIRLREKFSSVGIVLQAYMRRSYDDILRLIQANAAHVRVCKGIYIEPEVIAYQEKDTVRRNYLLMVETLIDNGGYPAFATHDPVLVASLERLLARKGLTPDRYEFQMLLGVSPDLRKRLVAAGHRLRVYVPYGRQWYGYSMRRLRENPTIARYVATDLFYRLLGKNRRQGEARFS